MNVHSVSSVTLETQLIHRPSKARSHWCALWWNRNVWFNENGPTGSQM